MKSETDILHKARWTDDPAQCAEFLELVSPKINSESKSGAHRYRVGDYHEDIESEIRLQLWQQMVEGSTDGPFAKDSPAEAANYLLGTSGISERPRTIARRIGKRRSRQAEILEGVCHSNMTPDIETELMAICRSFPLVMAKIPELTVRELDVLGCEILQQIDAGVLSADSFDRLAQAAGVSSDKARAYNEYHDKNGHSSDSNRKALSRARSKAKAAFYDKEKKALDREKFKSLLMIVLALSLALFNATHQDRSDHQNVFVNQSSFTHQPAVAHQGGNLIHQPEAARQGLVITNGDPSC